MPSDYDRLPDRDPSDPGPLTLTRSHALLEQSRALVPGLTHSMMKRPEAFCEGEFPVFLSTGRGAIVEDVDGNRYVDYVCGLGANALGHGHPAILRALQAQFEHGLVHSLPAPLEVDVARSLVEIIPGAEMARFFKTGADATSAAVRLARHVTGRERIVTVGYNGWHDHFMFDTPGVPRAFTELTTRWPLMAPPQEQPLLDLIEREGDRIAAVLLSLPYNRVVSREYLQSLKAACAKQGVRFIFDEVVTGFRLARGGAQEFYGIQADYVCVSKGLAAGMPLSAVVGPREALEPMAALQVSTTFGGELLSLAVCGAALAEYRDTDVIERAARLGKKLQTGVNAASEAQGTPLRAVGYDAIPFLRFAMDPEQHVRLAKPFVGAMARRGVLLRRDVSFVSGVHTEAQVEFTLDAVRGALHEMAGRGLFDANAAEARSA